MLQKYIPLPTPWCRVLLEKLTGSAASQENPSILSNPKVHHRSHKCPPPVPILSQLSELLHIPNYNLLLGSLPHLTKSSRKPCMLLYPSNSPKFKNTFTGHSTTGTNCPGQRHPSQKHRILKSRPRWNFI